jgi:hypothetical protein
LSQDELALKFRLNAGQALDSDQVTSLESAILELDTAPSVDAMMELTDGSRRT